MAFELDSPHDKYIKIKVSGVIEKATLISAISQLMNHPEYTDKHSYWDFTNASMGLTISDLNEIAGVLKLYKPGTKNFADKSALVVPGTLTSAMAEMFVKMSNVLPFKYRVFTEPNDAIEFLCS
ncbi:MAG: hypothetical protein HUN04_04525 [Desulfobacter sp.]|nr:MAG: hypothetical protein HUN04_04525 [Desulfobacter sp.]